MHLAISALSAVLPPFVFGAALTFAILRLASRLPWLARSSSGRLHVAPTPVWGGISIFVSFVSVALWRGTLDRQQETLAAAASGMFLLGLADDIWKLRPRWKLLGEVVCALTPISFVLRHPLTGSVPFDLALAALWVVGITNAFNLLDNVNGLAAGVAVLVSFLQGAFFWHGGQPALSLSCLTFAGAILGFLVFNFPAGRIFMGDSGSLFIGFWLASLTLTESGPAARVQVDTLLFPLLLMVVPICDTTLVTLTRVLKGRPISVGGTDHLSHRLMAYGLSATTAVLVLWGFTALSGALGLIAASHRLHPLASIVIFLMVVAAVLLGTYLTRFELHMHKGTPQAIDARPKVSSWMRLCSRAVFDLVLVSAAYYSAYLIRFDGQASGPDMHVFASTVFEIALIKLAVFVAFGAYRPWWDYFGLKDAYRLVAASGLASLTAVAYFSAVYRFEGFSRVVIALDFLIFTLLALVARFSFRLLDEVAPANHRTNVFIYGADAEGETALQLVSKHYRFRVMGFLDDDVGNRDFSIHSVPVRGGCDDIARLAEHWQTRTVVLTASVPDEVRLKLLASCKPLGIKVLCLRLTLEELETPSMPPIAELSRTAPPIATESSERPRVLRKAGAQ